MTDTHTHIYMSEFERGGIDAVERAIKAGVGRFVFPGVDMASLAEVKRLHELYPEISIAGIGLHPTELGEDFRCTLSVMENMLAQGGYGAIGETGIDLYHDDSRRDDQMESFAIQVRWAEKTNLPLIIHCRNGLDETLSVLEAHKGNLPKMVFHSFTGNVEDVRRIRSVCDPCFGINGVVTFKNAPLLREALPEIGIEKIVLETDAPWLAPVPFRGQRNESAMIPMIRDKVAETLGISPQEAEHVTDLNAAHLFTFP